MVTYECARHGTRHPSYHCPTCAAEHDAERGKTADALAAVEAAGLASHAAVLRAVLKKAGLV